MDLSTKQYMWIFLRIFFAAGCVLAADTLSQDGHFTLMTVVYVACFLTILSVGYSVGVSDAVGNICPLEKLEKKSYTVVQTLHDTNGICIALRVHPVGKTRHTAQRIVTTSTAYAVGSTITVSKHGVTVA